MRYLITQSLVSSWLYIFNCADGYEEDALQSFLDTLKRMPSEKTEAMQNGIDFERNVYRVANGGSPEPGFESWIPGIEKVAERISRAPTQVSLSRKLKIGDDEFVVYGILDALKAGVIFDVKFKNKKFGSLELAGDYLDSPQHPFYFYICPEAYEFNYLVSDGEDLYVETYYRNECRSAEDIISEFISWLKTSGYIDIYKEHWKAR